MMSYAEPSTDGPPGAAAFVAVFAAVAAAAAVVAAAETMVADASTTSTVDGAARSSWNKRGADVVGWLRRHVVARATRRHRDVTASRRHGVTASRRHGVTA